MRRRPRRRVAGDAPARLVNLPDALGRPAHECGHPGMRLLPDGVYRCPACGAEVVPVFAGTSTWKSPNHYEAYWSGWLDGCRGAHFR